MPPKSAKSEKKGGGASDMKAKDAVLSMFNQLEQDKVNALTRRVDEAVMERLELQRQLDKGNRDTHEFVNYFQLELEKKEEIIARLREQLKASDDAHETATADIVDKYEAQIKALEAEKTKMEAGLRARLRLLEDELSKLDEFREAKRRMEDKIVELEATNKAATETFRAEQADQERRFIMDKAKVQRAFDAKVAALEEENVRALEEGRDAATRRLIADNKRLKDELRFQQEVTDELKSESGRVADTNKKLLRELSLFEDKEQEYARQGKAKTKEIFKLQDKIGEAESTAAAAGRKAAAASETHSKHHAAQLEDALKDATALRQLLQLKNRELATLKQHATTVLEQRSEVEQFFLEALDQCKAKVAEERSSAHRQDLAAYRAAMREATLSSSAQALAFGRSTSHHSASSRTGGPGSAFHDNDSFGAPQQGNPTTPGGGPDTQTPLGTSSSGRVPFPKIRPAPRGGTLLPSPPPASSSGGGGGAGIANSALPLDTTSGKNVQLSDLSWSDRDRVLRLLFAKINAVQSNVKRMPEHPLQRTNRA